MLGARAHLLQDWIRSHTPLSFILLLLSVSVLPFMNSLENGFVWDDNYQLPKSSISAEAARRIFMEPSWGVLSDIETTSPNGIATYRPLLLLSFLVDYSLWGQKPSGYHVTNLLLHILVVFLIFLLSRQVTKRIGVSAVFATFCGTQPLFTDSVSWISGRHDILLLAMLATSSVFLVLALEPSRRLRSEIWLVGSAFFFVLALLSKETAVIFPAFCMSLLFTEPFNGQQTRVWRIFVCSFFLGIGGLYLMFRAVLISKGNMVGGNYGLLRILEVVPWAAQQYLSKFFFLSHLTSHYSHKEILVPNFSFQMFWSPLFIHAALIGLALTYRHRSSIPLLGLIWFYLFLSPAMVMVANNAELPLRFLTIPSLGLMAVVVFVGVTLYDRASLPMRRLLLSAICIAVVVNGWRIRERNVDYLNDGTFYSSIIRDVPESAFGYFGLGDYLQRIDQWDASRKAYEEALRRDPAHIKAYNNFGVLLMNHGQFENALAVFKRGILRASDYPKLHFNLAVLYSKMGILPEARLELAKALNLNPEYRQARLLLKELEP